LARFAADVIGDESGRLLREGEEEPSRDCCGVVGRSGTIQLDQRG